MVEETKQTKRGTSVAVVLSETELKAFRDVRHKLRFDKQSDALRAAIAEFVERHGK